MFSVPTVIRCLVALSSAAPIGAQISAQTAAEHIALGDRETAAFKPAEALRHYEAAIALESGNGEALGKASRAVVDLGEGLKDKARRTELFEQGEQYARRATAVSPNDAEAHFHLARALGTAALSVGVRDRVKYATEIHGEASRALTLNPDHPGALHVLGVWNAEVMRLSGVERFFAKRFLGGKIFNLANWKDAISYMERSVEVDPERITHKLDLARIYVDVGQKDKARAMYQQVIDNPKTDVNDDMYKEQARSEIARLR